MRDLRLFVPPRGAARLAAVPLVCGMLATGVIAAAPAPGASPPWARLHYFVGTWAGEGQGEPGASTVKREYRLLLRERFLEVRNTSTYLPQSKNPRGEVHEDIGFFSWDRARRRFVLRQFHVEGFVNHYVADSVQVDSDSLVFTSESIENIPAGFRARETLRFLGPDEFLERFEMAPPGQPFAVYSETRLRRVR
jgi:hypothetical protein